MELNNSKTINSWCFFDWANSAYSLVITATIFPAYFNAATRSAFQGDKILFLGMEIENTVLYSYMLSFSFLVYTLMSPFLSGIADYSGRKKAFMRIFTTLGSFACMGLFFFTGENVEWGVLCAVLASIGYCGGVVFYNAFLPEIVSEDRLDRTSARGFMFGYVGSLLLLCVNLAMILGEYPDKVMATRLSFLMVGLWWLGFAQITFSGLSDNPQGKVKKDMLAKGWQRLKDAFKEVRQHPNIKRFLAAFFSYNLGVQTILYLAATFAEKELHMESTEMIMVAILLQVVAVAGAYLAAKISDKKGNRFTLIILLICWIGICLAAYLITEKLHFFVLAGILGMVMGGVQSLSRSTYAKLLPEKNEGSASFFSLYDVMDKSSTVVGTFGYGLINMLTGSMRNSMLALGLSFIIGLTLLARLKIRETVANA